MKDQCTLTILAGGFGTRLKDLGDKTPKGLLTICDESVIDRLVRQTRLNKIVIVSNQKFLQQFKQTKYTVINNGVFVSEDSVGAVADAQLGFKNLEIKDCNFVTASDNVFYSDADIENFCSIAADSILNKRADVCVAVKKINLNDASKFGVVSVAQDDFIIDFVEKPVDPKSDLVALALYAFSKRSVDIVSKMSTSKSDNMGSMIEHLIKSARCLAIPISSEWFDIGTFETLSSAKTLFERCK
jgi:dTDP-glucose pyrophosphorylase